MKKNHLNTNCYITDTPFSKDNVALEHVIPNCLGGHLKSKRLVTKAINTGMFDKIDAELCSSIELSYLIKFKRDRGNQPKIIGTTSEGLKYTVNSDRIGKLLPTKPFEFTDKTGKKHKKFPLAQKEEIIASVLKKNPNLDRETIEKKIHVSFEPKNEKIHYKNGLNIVTSIDCFRAIAKIATNFFILNNGNKSYISGTIDFIKGGDLSKIKLGYFYPDKLLDYKFGENEVSHILYLKGCRKEKILYCYIELFTCHCFIVILNQNYSGPEINESYIWDLQDAKVLSKKISLSISRHFLMNRRYMFYQGVEEDYSERLLRLTKILNLGISKE